MFSPDGRLVATASDDGTGRIWDVASGQSLHVLRGHGAAVSSVTFSADGARVVTAGDDAIARIWDAHAGDSRLVLRASAGRVLGVAFSPDGRLIATGTRPERHTSGIRAPAAPSAPSAGTAAPSTAWPSAQMRRAS